MLGPFGTDAFVPALPSIAKDLEATAGIIQVSFGVFGLGMAIGQIVIGPLSDRYGRRFFLITGTLVVAMGAVVAASAQHASMLILGCLIMGLGGAASAVIVWAVVADHTHGNESARGLAIVDMFVSLGPILGPIGGAAIMSFASWRGIFLGVGTYSILAAVTAALFVKESLPLEARQKRPLAHIAAEYLKVFRNRTFMLRFASLIATFGILFAYIGASPFVLMEEMGLSPVQYSLVFALNGTGIIVASLITATLSRRVSVARIMGTGVVLQLISGFTLLTLIVTETLHLWSVIALLFVLIGSFGLIFGSGTALAIAEVRDVTGSALALLGASQFLVGGIAIAFIGLGDSAWMMGLAITALAVFSMICFVRASSTGQSTT